MPRTARLNYPGGVFHVISRCIGGSHLFKGDVERGQYLLCLERAVARTDALVLAYCLMSNHVHLVVVQGCDPLERLMKSTHTGFSTWLNHRRKGKGARGPVFAQRPRMVLVQAESYLLELVRYVHNNPVRAGIVRHARDSDWSSHGAFVGAMPVPTFLNVGYVLDRFGKHDAQRRFEEFVRAGEKSPRRADFAGEATAEAAQKSKVVLGDGFRASDGVMGDAAFLARVKADTERVWARMSGRALPKHRGDAEAIKPSIPEVQDAVCAAFGVEPWQFLAQPKQPRNALARRVIAWIWVHHFGGRQMELARELEVPTSTVARWYARASELAPETDEVASSIVAGLVKKQRDRRKLRNGKEPAVWFTVDVR